MKKARHAILFSGGGANAAYEVGVVKGLLQLSAKGRPGAVIVPDIFTGISIGAVNAAVMAAHADLGPRAAVDRLERVWLERIASKSRSFDNGLFRFRLDPLRYLDPRTWLTTNPMKPMKDFGADVLVFAGESFRRMAQFTASGRSLEDRVMELTDLSAAVDFGPLADLIREEVDIQKIGRSPAQLRVSAANWENGKPETFANEDLEGERGYESIAAAAAIPGVVPPRKIRDTQFVAGAVLSNSPVKPAILAARELDSDEGRELVAHVIYLDPESAPMPLLRVPTTLASSIRLYTIAFSRSVNADIERIRETNRRLSYRDTLDPLTERNSEAKTVRDDLSADLEGKIQLTVHRYRPKKTSSELFGLLHFERDRIEQLIETGEEDALHHNCELAGCVHPD